ncbi:phospholipase D-like domain-containing protein [Thermoplasma sp.]|uniref:phospholipase D-like domain-containing protein n=1 Tax=Thermoplasma sp. TaxID=1973142 RepID=UPI0012805182|nr:phospholipase D-like domain-containing protein [Thermoplasma sp.]KAA8922171.1 MAG: GTP-binding protein [Thermoplasma sp.]
MKIIVEPDDGIRPFLDAIKRARKFLYANFYLIDNKDILEALQDLKKRKVDVRVIYDGRPYGETNTSGESDSIRNYGINFKRAPERFDEPGVFDHAKYFVSDRIALIGTANASDASFQKNREYMYITRDKHIRKTLKAIFLADWNNTDDSKARRPRDMVVSPGSEKAICALISKARFIETEEMGDDPAVLDALKKRRRVKMILPSSVTTEDKQRLMMLSRSGVRIRLMPVNYLYMHAKMIYGDRVFIGSENFSATSLNRNREVGIVFDGFFAKMRIRRTFRQDWRRSTKI